MFENKKKIAEINSKWVFVFRDDVGEKEDDRLPVCYHEVNNKCGKIFEESKIWTH